MTAEQVKDELKRELIALRASNPECYAALIETLRRRRTVEKISTKR